MDNYSDTTVISITKPHRSRKNLLFGWNRALFQNSQSDFIFLDFFDTLDKVGFSGVGDAQSDVGRPVGQLQTQTRGETTRQIVNC